MFIISSKFFSITLNDKIKKKSLKIFSISSMFMCSSIMFSVYWHDKVADEAVHLVQKNKVNGTPQCCFQIYLNEQSATFRDILQLIASKFFSMLLISSRNYLTLLFSKIRNYFFKTSPSEISCYLSLHCQTFYELKKFQLYPLHLPSTFHKLFDWSWLDVHKHQYYISNIQNDRI